MSVHKIITVMSMVLLLSFAGVFAQSMVVEYAIVQDTIFNDESARIDVTLTNTHTSRSTFQVYSVDPRWIVVTSPGSIVLESGQKKVLEVFLTPIGTAREPASYSIPLEIKSSASRDIEQVTPTVIVKSDQGRQFAPAVYVDIVFGQDDVIDPRDDIEVRLRVVNRNRLQFDEFEVQFVSDLFTDTYRTSLDPNGDFFKVLTYPLDDRTPPQDVYVEVTVVGNGERIGAVRSHSFTIDAIYPRFQQQIVREDAWLKSQWEVSLTHVGNVPKQEQLLIPIGLISQWFVDASHGYERIVDQSGDRVLSFTVQLDPGQTTTVRISYSTRGFWITLLAIVLLLSVVIGGYYTLRTPIIVTRKAQIIGKADDHGVSKIKVMLTIINRTSRPVDELRVFERLSHITEVDEEFEVGTLKPSKVLRNTKRGTLVRWDFSTIEPFEERIITYKLHSKLSIIGDLTLPPTLVQFSDRGRQRRVNFSNLDK